MKRLHVLAVLCLGFFLPFILAGFPSVVINGEQSIGGAVNIPSMVKKTTADLNLYVRTTGDDSHDCLSAGAACLTIQEAVDRLPKQIYHTVLVDVGPGMFTYLTVSGFNIVAGSLTIQGTLDNPTLTTGTTSGTADGGSTTQCVDSGQTWTADELIGKLILVGGEYRVPYDNDGTTVYFQSPLAATCSGKTYEIVEQKTVLSGTEPFLGYGPVALANNNAHLYNIRIYNLKTSGGSAGFTQFSNRGSLIERCYNDGSYYGFFSEESAGYLRWHDCYSTANAGGGFVGSRDSVRNCLEGCVANNSNLGFYYGLMTGLLELEHVVAINGDTGIFFESSWTAFVKDSFIDGNSEFGIQTYETKAGRSIGSIGRLSIRDGTIVSNNTLGGVSVGKSTFLNMDAVTGAGNGGYGVELFSGAYVIINSTVSITGATGDATINDGTTTLTWATDFNDNGDIVVNLDNGCRIERRD